MKHEIDRSTVETNEVECYYVLDTIKLAGVFIKYNIDFSYCSHDEVFRVRATEEEIKDAVKAFRFRGNYLIKCKK